MAPSDGIGAGSMHRDDLRLQLTLDTRLQRVAQLELLRQVEKWMPNEALPW